MYLRKNYGFICQIKILVCLFACLFILLEINVLRLKIQEKVWKFELNNLSLQM